MNVVWMVIDRFFKSGTPVPPPMEARKILIPRNLNVMISRYEWFLTYFCQQAKKVEQVIFCPMNVPQPPFLSRWFKQVMYRSLKTGHIQVIFSFGSVGNAFNESNTAYLSVTSGKKNILWDFLLRLKYCFFFFVSQRGPKYPLQLFTIIFLQSFHWNSDRHWVCRAIRKSSIMTNCKYFRRK